MIDTWSHPDFARIARFVNAQTGLHFVPYRQKDAEAGIRRAMERAGVADGARYIALLGTERSAFDDLIIELTVGETYFFREAAQFAFLRGEVFPSVRRARGPEHALRIWSAGCASGEEAYSLAIALEEDEIAGQVLATDISQAALRKAHEASYGRWSLRGLDPMLVRRYFRRCEERWQLDARVCRRVKFEFHNLALGAYPSYALGLWGMDLILCRNVFIYFDQDTIQRVASGLCASLAEGGWLITGPSDPMLGAPFTAVVTSAGVFYRKVAARASSSLAPEPAGLRPASPTAVEARAPARERSDVEARGPAREQHNEPRAGSREREVDAGAGDQVRSPDDPARARGPLPDRGVEVPVALASTADRVTRARTALAVGDYERACELAREPRDEAGALVYVRALANGPGVENAEAEAGAQLKRFPLSLELQFLHAVLLFDLGRDEEAARALRRVLYLDRSLIIANFLLGTVLRRSGQTHEACRAYRNARDQARARPPQEQLALADGESAARIAEAAQAELLLLETEREAS